MAKKKDKGADAEAAPQETGPEPITLGAYPAAMASIRRVRARAGLAAFAVVLLLSLHHGLTLPSAAGRALLAGVAVQLLAWKIAVIVWRQIVLVQVRAAQEAHAERRRQLQEAAAERARAAAQAAA
jgi:hypothetical protein